MIVDISSATNQNIKHIRALSSKKERSRCKEYTVEGIKSVNEAIVSGQEIICLAMADTFDLSLMQDSDALVYRVPEYIFEKISDTQTPQGIMAVIRQPDTHPDRLKDNGLYLYCDGVQDPGNLGTLIRTADAAGFDGVILSCGCAELYNPKTVRASMGSFFRMKMYENADIQTVKRLKEQDAVFIAGALSENASDYRKADYSGTIVIVVGNEANGVSNEVLRECSAVMIPIYGGAESLNVAVAAGILMYEAANRKR